MDAYANDSSFTQVGQTITQTQEALSDTETNRFGTPRMAGRASAAARARVATKVHGRRESTARAAHHVVNSELHTRSEFCAACHEFCNPNGLSVSGMYGEWEGSSYAKRGAQCQDRHMPPVLGRVVALGPLCAEKPSPFQVRRESIY